MKIALNLLENSYDYLQESCRCFVIADEYGIHEKNMASYENKIKWKTAYVNLVQAFELLIKEVLRNIAPILIYEDIDRPITTNSKTVSATKGLERLSNCGVQTMTKENIGFIKECISRRNAFIHYNVQIESSEIKPSYCKLFELYIKIVKESLPVEFPEFEIMLKERCHFFENILEFAKGYVVFRNQEMKMEDKSMFLKEIALNKSQAILIDEDGNQYQRIPYGKELGFNAEYASKYCCDCAAAIGEFHYKLCDIEVCPKCGGQLLSCSCNLVILKQS